MLHFVRNAAYSYLVFTAHNLGRACRGADTSPDPDPPVFVTLPTVLARTAVRRLHTADAATAKQYLAQSKVGEWANHSRASMATSNSRVLDGFDWYVQEDAADGRPVKDLDRSAVVSIQGIDVDAHLDLVLDDGADIAGRVVLWDGPDFDAELAPTIACAYAHALVALYPGRNFTTVGIWQARRQYKEEVQHASAIARTPAAHKILAAM